MSGSSEAAEAVDTALADAQEAVEAIAKDHIRRAVAVHGIDPDSPSARQAIEAVVSVRRQRAPKTP